MPVSTASDLCDLSLSEALTGLRARSFSSLELAEALIGRATEKASLNALTDHDWHALRTDAAMADQNRLAETGAIGGVPLALKANIATTHLTTNAGTAALKSYRAPRNAEIATRLFDAGGLLGAKAGMHELAFGITSNNPATGAIHNPYDETLIPGGSSGGTAAAVAAGIMPAGIGTDTGGSVRLPAALCGLVGFRPSLGRYPTTGIVPMASTKDTPGPMTKTVDDAVLLDQVMADTIYTLPDLNLGDIRLGIPRAHFWDDLDPEIAGPANDFLDRLASWGVILIEADIPDVTALSLSVGFPVAMYEATQEIPAFLEEWNTGVSIQSLIDAVRSPDVLHGLVPRFGEHAIPESMYREAIDVARPKLIAAYENYFREKEVGAVLFPTAPLPPREIGRDDFVTLNGRSVATFAAFIRNTDPGSNAGLPGISMPIGTTIDGLPIGMELDGPGGSDRSLLAIAQALATAIDCRPRPY
ncbi:indoleacetamide hydrolase [Cucumibacter marinus]|uniref:indoleacetamide hydrolase n=1 Tax=Cucumibacter marinus TaxID=1121252 RepID=UPI000404311A|nr:indoleacetamide hydrolase [Cucumibacter marinus]